MMKNNSELSPQYQSWQAQIDQLTNLQSITHLQDRILADIHARRQDKISTQKVKEDLHQAQTGTPEQKEQAWENLEKQETEKGYQDNQAEVENLKKQKAAQNPQEYGQKAKTKIEQKLQDNGIKKDELSPENQQELKRLENEEITDPDQLVATETKIKQNIYQVEAQKKITDFTLRVNQVLKSKTKSQIATLKKELLAFISSSNLYYSSQKQAAENLLNKLESFESSNEQSNNTTPTSPSVPWKVVIPIFLVIGVIVLMVVVARRRKLKK